MKKQILLLFVSAVFFSSCSTDDNGGSASTDGALVKTISYTIFDQGNPSTSSGELHYSGTTIESLTSTTSRIEMEYSGNKVVATKHFTNNVLSRTNTYTYDGDKLTYVTSDDGERIHYTYNGETLAQAKSQLFDGEVWTDFDMEEYVFTQGNLTQRTRTNYIAGYNYRDTYTMDDKNNPTVNMNPYLRTTLNVPGIQLLSKNNPLSAQNFYPASAASPTAVYTYEYVYNAANYPTSIIKKEAGEVISETVITYL